MDSGKFLLSKQAADRRQINFLRSKDYAVVQQSTADSRPVLRHVIFWGQSLSNGTLATKAISTTAVYPTNALMFRLGDGTTANQSPWVSSYPITGVIPLVEAFERPNPTYIDPVDGTVVTQSATNMGETVCSGFANEVISRYIKQGLAAPTLLISIAGKGGETYAHIGPGTYTATRLMDMIAAGKAYADQSNFAYELNIVCIHGEDNTSVDDIGVTTDQRRPEEYANILIQWRDWIKSQASRICGVAMDPWLFVTQCNSEYPSTWPPSNGRMASSSEGQRMASELDPKIVLIGPNYAFMLNDRLHPLAEGYVNFGKMIAGPFTRTISGNGKWRPIRPIGARWITPLKCRVYLDTPTGQLRISGYTIFSATINASGSGYVVGGMVDFLGMDYKARIVIDTVDGSGAILTFHLVDPGSHSSDPTGTLSTLSVISSGTVVAGGTLYANGAVVSPIGGTYTRPAKFVLTATSIVNGSGGVVTAITLLDAGDYTSYPLAGASVSGGGSGASGLTITTVSIGSGATITAVALKQLAITNSVPIVVSNGGTGYVANDILTIAAGTQASGGYPAQIRVSTVSSGVITAALLQRSGTYTAAPSMPASVTGGTGTGATFTIAVGAFPVADPGFAGLDYDDDSYTGTTTNTSGTAKPAITAINIVTEKLYVGSAIDITIDQPAGINPRIMFGQHTLGQNGPASGARTNICARPSMYATAGPFNQFPQDWLIMSKQDLPAPPAFPFQPGLDNTQFAITEDIAIATPTSLTTAGAYVAGRWRAYRAVAGGTAQLVIDADGERAIRLQRDSGNTATSAISCSQSFIGTRAEALQGKKVTIGVRVMAGPTFTGGSMIIRVYTHTAVTSYGTLATPASSTSLFFASKTITSSYDDYAVALASVTVPSNAVMIVYYIQWTPVGTADVDDWIQFKQPRLVVGTLDRPFVPLPEDEERLRCMAWWRSTDTQVGVIATPENYLLSPPMRTTPTITGGGTGFSSTGSTATLLRASQTTGGAQTLILNARN